MGSLSRGSAACKAGSRGAGKLVRLNGLGGQIEEGYKLYDIIKRAKPYYLYIFEMPKRIYNTIHWWIAALFGGWRQTG